MHKEIKSGQLYKDIPTARRHICVDTFNGNGFIFDVQITPDNFRDQFNKEFLPGENQLRFDSEAISPNLEKSFNLVRSNINGLRTTVGLSQLDLNEIEISLLERPNFIRHYQEIFSKTDSVEIGFCADTIKPVVIMKLTDTPEYVLASLAFHELIHKYFELNVSVFHLEKTPDGNSYVLVNSRRSGLRVNVVKNNGESVEVQNRSGNLLNELPNYYFQKNFMNDILENENIQGLYSTEISQRNKLLKNFFKLGNDYAYWIIGEENEVVFHRSLFHFDNNGELLLENHTLPFLIMQLTYDLSMVCGPIDGKSFWEVFLQAKIDPKIQIKLKQEIDAKLGKGTFQKLKNARYEYEDVLSILTEIQRKLYYVVED